MFEGGEPCILVFSARLLAAGRPIRERLQSNRESPAVQGDVAARACCPEPKGRFFSNLIRMDPRDAWLPGRFHRTDSWSDVAPMRCRMTGRSARSAPLVGRPIRYRSKTCKAWKSPLEKFPDTSCQGVGSATRISLFRACGVGCARRGSPSWRGFGRRQQVLSESENVVDEVKKSLHNLPSLLQMQRRLTKRCRVGFAGAAGLSESIFKN